MHRDEDENGDVAPGAMNRRAFVVSGVVSGTLALAGTAIPRRADAANVRPVRHGPEAWTAPDDFPLAEITIDRLQQAMQSGQYTARSIAEQYLARIDALDQRGPTVNAIIELNPEALAIADALDAERKSKGSRGAMHGIPVLIKDNIATADKMQTTAGSLALVDGTPPRDAHIVDRMRAAGAVILGKTNLSEWANYRSAHSCSGWSGRGGQTRDPYALDRNPSGSSSGSAVATSSNFCTVSVGTETDGSIVSPSSCCSLVGLKPTVGLLSRAGIVPISHSQDTSGPICRTVRDAAILLGAMAGIDPRDPATAGSHGKAAKDYTTFLDPSGLKGTRIGVARAHYFGYNIALDKAVEDALDVMRREGATIVDPADLTTSGQYDDDEAEVLLYEFKADLNHYLSELGASARVHTLADVIAFNDAHHDTELRYFPQDLMLLAQAKGPLTTPKYLAARAKCIKLSRTLGIDHTMDQHRLDAIIAPTGAPPWPIDLVNGDGAIGTSAASSSTPAAVAGYPSITVPVGFTYGLPLGMSFIGRAYSEGLLLRLAYAYEQLAPMRQPPQFRPSADIEMNGRPKR
jgi:amidase